MVSQADDVLTPPEVGAVLRPPGPVRHATWRADFTAVKPTLVAVAAVIVVAVIAVSLSLVFYSTGPAGDVSVSESDYRIAMPTNLHAGSHTIALTNNGKVGHELLLFRTNLPATALPVDAKGDVNEDSPVLHKALDSGDALTSGGDQSVPVTLDPGHYVAVCNLPGHYHLGMRLDITVTR